jgi:NADP-dependent 3-hydroxy acid dehydrogenase YdfG
MGATVILTARRQTQLEAVTAGHENALVLPLDVLNNQKHDHSMAVVLQSPPPAQ